MIFNSLTYLVFLAAFCLLYWTLPRPARLLLILGSSLVFYGFWRVEYIPVMLASVTVDYVLARKINGAAGARRRGLLVLSLFTNLGLLAYFKYTIFIVDNLSSLAGLLGGDGIAPPDILLPLGISFYTFQSISYTVDVYRGHARPERSFVLFAGYVTFFPQLVAGPILRANEVIWQLDKRPAFNLEDIAAGVRRILCGLFLKVVLADNVAAYVDDAFALAPHTLSAYDVGTMCLLFGFQIYFDFSAYSHIAIGSARLMGIRFPENFNFPYSAVSPRQFWQRWHISLSSWIRDYLYLPLRGLPVRDSSEGGVPVGDAKGGESARRTGALFATWALMGLWHGAAWTFVLWGVWHAVLVLGYRLIAPAARKLRLPSALGWCATFPLIMLGWLPFRAGSIEETARLAANFSQAAKYYDPLPVGSYLLSAFPRNLNPDSYVIAAVLCLMVLVAPVVKDLYERLAAASASSRFAMETMTVVATALLVFIYLRPIRQFIYFQF
ncbi:MAG TPA: alginate O-acetyltransferase [Rhodospirillaceae bacterium]|nr:alginate O-acetyltransferase [Rhodospirillaceae bacterium]|tara:strand:+ start:87965 stop:89452 length:1488 start_codon:yes stop_codon:yes gene_type:complete